jgi:hypothetical protein
MPTLVPVQTRPAAAPARADDAARPSAASAAAPALSLRIDSLVLHGFAPAEARRVGAAFEGELARLLSTSPLHGYAASPAASAPSPRLSIAPARAEAAGAASARALHARLRA